MPKSNTSARLSSSTSPTSVVAGALGALVDLLKSALSLLSGDVTAPQKDDDKNKDHDMNAIEKLFTSKEESHLFHVHKILGFSVLASFLYRFTNLGARDGGFGPTLGTIVFILHHWFLNASSFIFEIPQRRIRDGGFRIWPEYRIHSLVFTSRSLACMLLIWTEQTTKPAQPYYFMDLLIVLATCAGADYGSSLQGKHKSNTVRGTTYSDPYGQWFASEMQFNLSALCLIGMRRYTMHLVAVCVIQVNSFLMTLRRKNVASHEVLTAIYGLLLVLAFWVGVMEEDYNQFMYPAIVYGSLAVILRMGPLHVNKYVLWTGLWLSLHIIRTYDLVKVEFNGFWLSALIITKSVALGLGLYKRQKELKARKIPLNAQSRMVHIAMGSYALHFSYLYYRFIYLGELWKE